jgi:hypothetical protein
MDLKEVIKRFDYYNLKLDNIYNNLDLINILETQQSAMQLIKVVIDDEDFDRPIYNLEKVIEHYIKMSLEYKPDIKNINNIINFIEEYKNKHVQFEKEELNELDGVINKLEEYKKLNVKFEEPNILNPLNELDEDDIEEYKKLNVYSKFKKDEYGTTPVEYSLEEYKNKNVKFKKPNILDSLNELDEDDTEKQKNVKFEEPNILNPLNELDEDDIEEYKIKYDQFKKPNILNPLNELSKDDIEKYKNEHRTNI